MKNWGVIVLALFALTACEDTPSSNSNIFDIANENQTPLVLDESTSKADDVLDVEPTTVITDDEPSYFIPLSSVYGDPQAYEKAVKNDPEGLVHWIYYYTNWPRMTNYYDYNVKENEVNKHQTFFISMTNAIVFESSQAEFKSFYLPNFVQGSTRFDMYLCNQDDCELDGPFKVEETYSFPDGVKKFMIVMPDTAVFFGFQGVTLLLSNEGYAVGAKGKFGMLLPQITYSQTMRTYLTVTEILF